MKKVTGNALLENQAHRLLLELYNEQSFGCLLVWSCDHFARQRLLYQLIDDV